MGSDHYAGIVDLAGAPANDNGQAAQLARTKSEKVDCMSVVSFWTLTRLTL